MHAAVFFTNGGTLRKHHSLKVAAETAEECLRLLANNLEPIVGYRPTLSFRPVDGLIFCHDWHGTPVGVLYREGYSADSKVGTARDDIG